MAFLHNFIRLLHKNIVHVILSTVYISNVSLIKEAIKTSGFGSVTELAKHLGVHRNTLQNYFSGQSLLPKHFTEMLQVLHLSIDQALVQVTEEEPNDQFKIAPLVDQLLSLYPNACFVLFGSRAKQIACAKYSDFDVGIYSHNKLAHADYRQLIKAKNEWEENSPYFVDLVNLHQAPDDFLTNISKNWIFLAGRSQDWLALNAKVQHAHKR